MILTKSRFMIGLQCLKHLWISVHEPERIPKADEAQLYLFKQGKKVGQLAKTLFPDGIDIPADDFGKNLLLTKEYMKKGKPLFEAGFAANNFASRADILEPKDGAWDLTEVKMSTELKDDHIMDVSFQKFCYEQAGLKIRKCFLLHINKEYIKKGKIDPKKLLVREEITNKLIDIKNKAEEMLKVINAKKCPESALKHGCHVPYECPIEECWNFLPENNVFRLYSGRKTSFELYEKGIMSIKDIPDSYVLTSRQGIQRSCAKTGKIRIHREGIRKFLQTLKYPLCFIDFETFNTAIPMYDDTKPFQHIPFQFSLHIVEKEGAKPRHYSFIAEGKEDPREKFVEELKNNMETKGSVVVYNQVFEQSRLKELAEAFPKYKKWVKEVTERMIDLLLVFRNFDYYNPKQEGSASLKEVLPAITGKSYEDLEIKEGGTASTAFVEMAFSDISEKEKEKIRKGLEAYCGLDTEGLIWIIDELRKLVE